MPPQPAEVLLGLGSNLRGPREQLRGGVRRIASFVTVDAVSALYRTEPVGFRDQPEFLNLVLRGRTLLSPRTLLKEVNRVEQEFGRTRSVANAPRTLDVDVLCYGTLVLDSADLVLPHPRLHHRAFVLVPLAEVSPQWRHPILDATASELLAAVAPPERVECDGVLHW